MILYFVVRWRINIEKISWRQISGISKLNLTLFRSQIFLTNVHFSHCTGNVNECCYCCYYSRYSFTIELIQAWKRTGNDIRAWTEWEGAHQPGPGHWSHAPSVQLSAGYQTLTVSLHGNDLRPPGIKSAQTQDCCYLSLLALLFQNNTAFSFLAAFSTFSMQSWNSCV